MGNYLSDMTLLMRSIEMGVLGDDFCFHEHCQRDFCFFIHGILMFLFRIVVLYQCIATLVMLPSFDFVFLLAPLHYSSKLGYALLSFCRLFALCARVCFSHDSMGGDD